MGHRVLFCMYGARRINGTALARNMKNLRILVADMHDPDNRTTDYGYPQAEDDG